MKNVWEAASEGKGLTLLVEKDYQITGYHQLSSETEIFLTPPVGKYKVVLDVADDIIEIVKEKGGNIVILENGALKNFNHIALILRYEK